MLYFAYGSNMNWGQMSARCPSAKFVGVAVFPDHRLEFTRKSVARGCGVADMVSDKNCLVWGVVYELSNADVDSLDTSEGYRPGRDKNSYWRRGCRVFLDGDGGRPIQVATYFAERQLKPPPPSQEYKKLIVEGARHWQLPAEYIVELERIRVDR